MSYPNAFSGVKKLFTAQILTLIGAIIIAFVGVSAGAVVTSGTSVSIDVGAGVGAGAAAVALVASILILVAFVMNLVGLYQAGKDEQRYLKPAFIISIVVLILSIIAGFFSQNPTVQSVMQLISSIAQLIVMILVIQGISELALSLNQTKLADFGRKILYAVIIAQAIALIANFMGTGNAAVAVALVGSIFSIVAYIAYLVFLSRGKNMLATF